MASFHYLATGPGGGAVRGRIEAADRTAALQALDGMGLEARTLGGGTAGSLTALLSSDLGRSRSHATALLAFTREMALLLGARIGLAQALDMLIGEGGKDFAALPLPDLLRRIRNGEPFADAMAAHPAIFARDYVGLVRVGQTSGTLATVMANLAQMLERRAAYRSRLVSALAYPAILLLASAGTIAVLVQIVLPSFAPLFNRAGLDLPWTTQIVIAAAKAAPALAMIAGIGLVVGIGGWIVAGQDPVLRLARDRWAMRMPFIGPMLLLGGITGAFRSLGIMVTGGLQLRPALDIAATGARNAALAALLTELGQALERGERLSDALRSQRMIPPAVPRLVHVGEESGELGPALLHLADLLDGKLQQRLERAMALVTPALTLLVGGIIAFVLVAVMGAVLGANQLVVAA